MTTRASQSSSVPESVYTAPGEASPDAIIKSLQALLPTRRHPIARRRFTVLDTFDGRVRRAGARLTRTGTQGTSTLTWRPQGGRGVEMRLAQPVRFAWDLPESPLQQALAPVIGVRRLLAQADAEKHGSLLDVLDGRGKTVARLSIESGQARLPTPRRAWQLLPTVVTLTGLRGYQDMYERLVPVIESRPGITRCPDGLQGVILRQVGAPELEGSCPRVEFAPTVRAAAGAREIHLALLTILAANEPGLRANLDTEFLHDFRVAVRRTRSLLGQIKDVFSPDGVEHFSTEFSWLGRLTGPARDMDVLVLALRHHLTDVPATDRESLMTYLGQFQQEQRDRLIEALDSNRYRQLLSDWKAFLERRLPVRSEPANAARPLRDVVSERAWRLGRRIAERADTIDAHTDPERIHQIRIDAKKLRYLVDVSATFYDPADLECVLGALKKLQRVLGDFNDAAVHETRLLELARGLSVRGGPAGALVALGRLAEQSRHRREQLRRDVVDNLTRFRAGTTRSACRRAFKRWESPEPAR